MDGECIITITLSSRLYSNWSVNWTVSKPVGKSYTKFTNVCTCLYMVW